MPADDEERFWRALDDDAEHHGPPQILLTVFYHARSATTILARYPGAALWAPAAAETQARERVAVAHVYGDGDVLPGGIEGRTTEHRAEAVLWIPSHNALAAGDLLLGTADGGVRVVPDSWLRPGVTGAMIRDGLRPLLDLPLELLLLTHGEPVLDDARAKLARGDRLAAELGGDRDVEVAAALDARELDPLDGGVGAVAARAEEDRRDTRRR